jgi:hypothetical protein
LNRRANESSGKPNYWAATRQHGDDQSLMAGTGRERREGQRRGVSTPIPSPGSRSSPRGSGEAALRGARLSGPSRPETGVTSEGPRKGDEPNPMGSIIKQSNPEPAHTHTNAQTNHHHSRDTENHPHRSPFTISTRVKTMPGSTRSTGRHNGWPWPTSCDPASSHVRLSSPCRRCYTLPSAVLPHVLSPRPGNKDPRHDTTRHLRLGMPVGLSTLKRPNQWRAQVKRGSCTAALCDVGGG